MTRTTKRRSKNPKVPHWQELVDHVNNTWKRKKKSEFNYPFMGRDMKDLAHFARVYQPYGVMALWDVYLKQADEWTLKHGLSIYIFTTQLPRLVDQDWKGQARIYQEGMPDTPPEKIAEVIEKMPNFIKPKKRRVFTTRSEWSKAELDRLKKNNH